MPSVLDIFIIAGVVLVTLGTGVCWLVVRRNHQQLQDQHIQAQEQLLSQINHLSNQTKQLQKRYRALNDSLTEQEQRFSLQLNTILEQYEQVKNQLQDVEQSDPEIKLYHQAKQLISAGAPIEEVIESCGIPRAEAELLRSLHGQ